MTGRGPIFVAIDHARLQGAPGGDLKSQGPGGRVTDPTLRGTIGVGLPFSWIVQNVFGDPTELLFASYHVFVETALPHRCACNSSHLVHRAGRMTLKGTHYLGQRSR